MEKRIALFFERYAAFANAAIAGENVDAKVFANNFAEFLVESSPVGVMGGKNDDSFAAKISSGFDFYRQIGITAMNIIEQKSTFIDELHAIVKVTWSFSYTKAGKANGIIEFDVHYLLNLGEDLTIFSYITGDEQASLKKHGLI